MKEMVCSQWGAIGRPQKRSPGSFWGELASWVGAVLLAFLLGWFGWLILLLPLGYTLWRTIGRASVCGKCGAKTLVPLDSPIGEDLRRRFGPKPPPVRVLPDFPPSIQPNMEPVPGDRRDS
jgi:hypothetical protein